MVIKIAQKGNSALHAPNQGRTSTEKNPNHHYKLIIENVTHFSMIMIIISVIWVIRPIP